ncbi:cytidine/deoxycytidylate deaminase family protein [Candidatus Poribacteria bacterium]|nr:cytidine/deoxycytidylate deaminase family protein [Candidatus Poribacteria bacterium]
MTRPTWDEYFLEIARLVSSRSTCLRRAVGAVFVREKRVLSTGYNGAPSGLKHCEEVGCIRERERIPSGERHELCRGIHAEQNAILQAAQFGISLRGSILYCTNQPCVLCAKMLINAGVERIVVLGGYPDRLSREMLEEAAIQIVVKDTQRA